MVHNNVVLLHGYVSLSKESEALLGKLLQTRQQELSTLLKPLPTELFVFLGILLLLLTVGYYFLLRAKKEQKEEITCPKKLLENALVLLPTQKKPLHFLDQELRLFIEREYGYPASVLTHEELLCLFAHEPSLTFLSPLASTLFPLVDKEVYLGVQASTEQVDRIVETFYSLVST